MNIDPTWFIHYLGGELFAIGAKMSNLDLTTSLVVSNTLGICKELFIDTSPDWFDVMFQNIGFIAGWY